MSVARYPSWAHELSDRQLTELFGAATLARGQTYARQGRVGYIGVGSGDGGSLVQARVRGSAHRVYQTVVSHDAQSGRLSVTCSCPVGASCKHGAAVVLHARLINQRAVTPAWQRALAEVTDGLSSTTKGEPLALMVTRKPGVIALHPLVWGRSGRWIRTGIDWDTVQHPWGRDYRAAHREALVALAQAHRRSASYYSHRVDELRLGELDASVWRGLRQTVAAGVELIPGRDTPAVRIGEPARLVSRLTQDGEDLQLRTVAANDEFERAVPYASLLGDPPHGFAVEHEQELLLVPFAEPLSPGRQRLLLQHSRLQIPATELSRFAAEFVPALRRLVRLEVSDDIVLPEVAAPRLRLAVEFRADHLAVLDWGFRYQVGDGAFDVGLDVDGPQPVARDLSAEADLLGTLPAGQWPTRTESAASRPSSPATLAGPQTAEFVELDLPQLRKAGVIVEVTGTPADYRLAAEAPQISFSVTAGEDGSDWFNLDVRVSIEGEPVEYRELFTALATGETHLVLPSGTWFSLASPELEQLRALIAEASELSPAGERRLRLRTTNAGLWGELVSLGVVGEQSARWHQSVSTLLELTELPELEAPAGLAATLRPYQLHGFRWLHFLHSAGLGGILADDMGLGKTMQALALACELKHAGALDRPMLVVAPTSVLGTWAAEAARFAPGLDLRVVAQTSKKRKQPLAEVIEGADLVVTSYTLLRLDEADYLAQPWAVVLLDEAQFVKNRQARGHQAVRKLSARAKFAITGTPLENNLMDLWSLLSIVAPGLFADPVKFTDRYRKPIEAGSDPSALGRLHRRTRPLMLRRTKATVAAELPEKQEQVLAIELTPAHRRLYDRQLAAERKKVLGLVGDLKRNRITILAALTKLRQLALSPDLVGEGNGAVSAKIDALIEMVTELAAEGHRALVFSQFTGYLGLVRQRLAEAGIGFSYLDGRTRDRAPRIEQFRTGTDPVFLISLKAGGFGLTLTEADYVFILDPWWNPAAELQAIDRTHRIGQDKPVLVYRMVSADTIEEKVVALQQRKRDLFAKVMGSGGDLAAPLTADDIRGLLEH